MAQADAHACLLDALDLRKVAVISGSMGAPSAMHLCLRHPDCCSSMVLLFPIAYAPCPTGKQQERPSALAEFMMKTPLRSDFFFWTATKLARDTMIERILAKPIADFSNAVPDEQARVRQVLRNLLPISQREKGLRNDIATAISIPRYELERLTVPILIVSAEDDLFGTFRRGHYTAKHIPGARFVGYATGRHLLVGHRDDVSSVVTEFLNGLSDERHSTAH